MCFLLIMGLKDYGLVAWFIIAGSVLIFAFIRNNKSKRDLTKGSNTNLVQAKGGAVEIDHLKRSESTKLHI